MSHKDIVNALIDSQGTLFSEEMGANIARDTPQELFHWLEGAILLSARIATAQAIEAAQALRAEKLHKIDEILAIDKWDMVAVLRHNGYKRYDTVTTEYIKDAAQMVRDRYDDDLRGMKSDDPDEVIARIKEVKGIGDVGADIFAREVQLVWDVFYPRADGPALDAAKDLGLPTDPQELAALAGSRERFVRLMAALTRAALDGPSEQVWDAA
ncbi:hypothetical protein [Pontivivens ytuae]|uniref:Endonuclease n=1 Tax=Pontivivens ytuae TaxID=2789856 RepID=A0A7S9QC58_9RHOB|nr:hypothetical protein [Pontivivens ytuae]QPH53047.1 hypothetical protein I0K15_14730 [Pontivivens ytuae]